jgi:hypothetical protein
MLLVSIDSKLSIAIRLVVSSFCRDCVFFRRLANFRPREWLKKFSVTSRNPRPPPCYTCVFTISTTRGPNYFYFVFYRISNGRRNLGRISHRTVVELSAFWRKIPSLFGFLIFKKIGFLAYRSEPKYCIFQGDCITFWRSVDLLELCHIDAEILNWLWEVTQTAKIHYSALSNSAKRSSTV